MNEDKHLVRKIDDQTIEVSLPNITGYERIAMDCSASFARIVGFVSDRIDDLKMAVSEACLNAMEHGNKGRPNARVIVTMNFIDGDFSVSVLDEGDGIEKFPEEPDIVKKINNLQTIRGHGLFLIKRLVDQVEFNNMTREGHIVKMIIKMRN